MVCYNNYTQPVMDNSNQNCSCMCGNGKGFSCIINLIIILVVLQFLSQLLCSTTCDIC